MELINIAGIALLMLLVRKLIWCLRWLWCYYHGRPTPEPISFLPRRSGSVFNGHVDQTGRDLGQTDERFPEHLKKDADEEERP